jgi:hypothetical protein
MTAVGAPPALVLGRLADERRLRALAAVALGATRVADVAERADLSDEDAARALAHLLGAGILRRDDSGLHVDLRTFSEAARAAASPRVRPVLEGATPEQERVARNFVGTDGRLTALPARAAKRRLVLEWVVSRFDEGRSYSEPEVNGLLLAVHDDVASLRRFLVDEGLLERQAGVYQRAGPVGPR